MRYLGLVTSLSVVPHVRDSCITEMIARACKNILNKQIAAMILEHQRRFSENEERREQLKRQWNNRHYMSNSNLNTT
jgi:tryptophanyl-tRNA synthetase